jgi:ATP-dependent protease HslVU (ClpYQ) peptidase subunit
MTICIAAKYDGGILCASDTALTYGDNRFHTPQIKGGHRWDGYVLYAGETWLCHEVLWDSTTQDLNTVIRTAAFRYKDAETGHPVFPAEFIQISYETGGIYLLGQGDVFGPYDYACIGSGSSTAWPVLDVLYRRLRTHSRQQIRRVLQETMRMCERYDSNVYRPFLFEDVVL